MFLLLIMLRWEIGKKKLLRLLIKFVCLVVRSTELNIPATFECLKVFKIHDKTFSSTFITNDSLNYKVSEKLSAALNRFLLAKQVKTCITHSWLVDAIKKTLIILPEKRRTGDCNLNAAQYGFSLFLARRLSYRQLNVKNANGP